MHGAYQLFGFICGDDCLFLDRESEAQQLHVTVTVLLPSENRREPVAGQLLRTEMLTCCCCPGDSTPADGEKATWSNPLLDAVHDALP
jgi:hypothetical protein